MPKPHHPLPLNPDLRKTIRAARMAEKAGQLDIRDGFADQIFREVKNGRLVTNGETTVDTWWDVKTRSFITAVRRDGRDVLPVVFSRKETAAVVHLWGLYSLFKKPIN